MKQSITSLDFSHGPFLVTLLLLLLHATLITPQEVEDEREFEYVEGSKKGPENWGMVHKEWEACSQGRMQSPIDMSNKRVEVIPRPGQLKNNYLPANATIKNRGHDIMLEWVGDAGFILINGTQYFLRQAHWHSPSEHTINGKRFALELHMVHVNEDPNVKTDIAVVGVLYKIGTADTFLSKLMSNISSMADKKDERYLGTIDPTKIQLSSIRYYSYIGSLTVPPCTEGVIWIIKKQIRSLSREQVRLLREAVHDYAEQNARPLQPDNNRQINLYGNRDDPS